MRPLLLLVLLISVSLSGKSQCDSIQIEGYTYHPFSDSAFTFNISSVGQHFISYPNFAFVDANGDTIAKSTVNTFGLIGGAHQVPFTSLYNGSHQLNGQLLIYGDFEDSLFCTKNINEDLCQDDTGLFELEIYLGNFGGALVFDHFKYELRNQSGGLFTTGKFHLHQTAQYATDTLLIPKGNYELWLDSNTYLGGQVYYGAHLIGNTQAYLQDQYLYEKDSMLINIFESCDSVGQSVGEIGSPTVRFWYFNQALHADLHVEVKAIYNLLGKQISFSNEESLPLRFDYKLQSGIYLVTYEYEQKVYTHKVYIDP